MFGARPNYVKMLVILALVILALLAGAVASVKAVVIREYANPYYIVCFDPLMTNVVLTLPTCGSGEAVTERDNDEPFDIIITEELVTVPPPLTITPPPVTPPVTPPPSVTPEPSPEPSPETPVETPRPHCNNGEGNGSEGCSPSENGNNDENDTSPSEDAHNKNG
jgi:hypothetical protein